MDSALPVEDDKNENKVDRVEYLLLHRRLGHLNFNSMKALVKDHSVRNIEVCRKQTRTCEDCVESKFTAQPFQTCMFPIKTTRLNAMIIQTLLVLLMDRLEEKDILFYLLKIFHVISKFISCQRKVKYYYISNSSKAMSRSIREYQFYVFAQIMEVLFYGLQRNKDALQSRLQRQNILLYHL